MQNKHSTHIEHEGEPFRPADMHEVWQQLRKLAAGCRQLAGTIGRSDTSAVLSLAHLEDVLTQAAAHVDEYHHVSSAENRTI